MDPIGNKPFGFYGSSVVYTMSLFNSIKIQLLLLFIVKGKNQILSVIHGRKPVYKIVHFYVI